MELNPHIKPEPALPPPPLEEQEGIDECRLWIGNISPQITEFTLLKVLQKHGRLKKYDFLYHKSGPDQGKPRGYCFVTYETREEAEKAKKSMNGKLALDRRLVVKHAHLDRREEEMMKKKPRKDAKEPELIKSAPEMTTETKIRAIEAKLSIMEGNQASGVSAYIPPPRQPLSITTAAALAAAEAKKPKYSRPSQPRPRPRHNKPYHRR